jgi:hypothetical protein
MEKVLYIKILVKQWEYLLDNKNAKENQTDTEKLKLE